MATKIEQIKAEVARLRDSASTHRARFMNDRDALATDSRLTAEAKAEDIAHAREKANETIAALNKKEKDYLAGTREALRKDLFSIGFSPSASDLMALRDANDRVASFELGDEAKAMAMYRQAQEAGDKTFVSAIVSRSYEVGFNSVVNEFAESSPYNHERLEALVYLDGRSGNFQGQFQGAIDYSPVS